MIANNVIRFRKKELLKLTRTGWKKALGESAESYDQSVISVGGLQSSVPLLGVSAYIHEPSQSSEESDSNDEPEEPPPKKTRVS